MPVRIENQTCYFTVNDDGQEQRLPATAVTVNTDIAKAMSYVDVNGDKVYVTEQQADALREAAHQRVQQAVDVIRRLGLIVAQHREIAASLQVFPAILFERYAHGASLVGGGTLASYSRQIHT